MSEPKWQPAPAGPTYPVEPLSLSDEVRDQLDRWELYNAAIPAGCYHGPDCLECNGWPPIDPVDTHETETP